MLAEDVNQLLISHHYYADEVLHIIHAICCTRCYRFTSPYTCTRTSTAQQGKLTDSLHTPPLLHTVCTVSDYQTTVLR
jgi:hypothetical protein